MFKYLAEGCFTLMVLGQAAGIVVALTYDSIIGLFIGQVALGLAGLLVMPQIVKSIQNDMKFKKKRKLKRP